MNLPVLALLIDSAAIILLIAVIFYSIRLNKYFTLLRDGKNDLARQLSVFADSTKRAEDAIERMKTSTHENAALLDQQIRRAELVRKDLSHNVTSSNRTTADRPSGASAAERRKKTAEESQPKDGASSRLADRAAGVSARSRLMKQRRANASDTLESREEAGDSGGEFSRKQRSKSKSELLKALQGMR